MKKSNENDLLEIEKETLSIEENKKLLASNELKIKQLMNDNIDLRDKINLQSDYRESIEKWRPDEPVTVGRVYYFENFKDGDTGEDIAIERNYVCRVNGKPATKQGMIIEKHKL